MKHRNAAIVFFVLGLLLFSFAAGMIFEARQEEKVDSLTKILQENKILDGSSLRGMMNEAKYSPGLAIDFAIEYPTYAYLFDGSFITYVDN